MNITVIFQKKSLKMTILGNETILGGFYFYGTVLVQTTTTIYDFKFIFLNLEKKFAF
jgi:hypothetical protein